MRKSVLVGTVLLCFVCMPSFASDPFDEAFSQFKAALQTKDQAKALKALRSALESFWAQSPLILENARFVTGGDNSYGIYEPREGDRFKSGETIYLYMEPAGYTLKKNPKGQYEFGFVADFTVADDNGQELGGQKDFASLDFRSWNYNTEIALTFDYSISGVDEGKFKIITVVKDKFSDKKATVEKWVTFGK
jgi:hypothetical protein